MQVEIPLAIICVVVCIATGWLSYVWRSQVKIVEGKMDKETCEIKHKGLEKQIEMMSKHISQSLEEIKKGQNDIWHVINELKEIVYKLNTKN